jgi:hypothetical protein
MAELKTKKTKESVTKYIDSLDASVREDAKELLKIFQEVTKERPAMWGTSIIGFGQYHYKSDRSRQEGDWPLTGFASRKQNLTIYIMSGFKDSQDLLKKLGKHKTSVSCLYIKKLEDIDTKVLRQIIKRSYEEMKKRYLD